jgi:hypothetical protein
VGVFVGRELKDSIAAAEPAMQIMQVEAIRFFHRVSGTEWKAFDVQLRECPRDVGNQCWPIDCGRGAEKLDY